MLCHFACKPSVESIHDKKRSLLVIRADISSQFLHFPLLLFLSSFCVTKVERTIGFLQVCLMPQGKGNDIFTILKKKISLEIHCIGNHTWSRTIPRNSIANIFTVTISCSGKIDHHMAITLKLA